MHPDMIHLVERLVVAVERISQDVNNISAYIYDLSYSASHLRVERKENEDISFIPNEEDENCPSNMPVAGQEASAEREYSLQCEQASSSTLSHIQACGGDTASMSIDDNEDCVVLSSFTGAVKTERKSESEEDDKSCDVHNTHVDGSKNMRDVAAVIKKEINFSEELLSEERNSVFPIETQEYEDCSAHMDRNQGNESSGVRTCKLVNTCTFITHKTHADRSHLMVPMRVYAEETSVSESSLNANSHLESPMQLSSGGKSFECRECGKEFMDSYHLIRHTRVHTREKPYRCTVCGRVFTRSDKLTSHMRIHTGEKPYKCSVCEYACSRSDNLASHMHIHTRDGPYRCSVCGNAYAQSGGLKAHMGVHTGDCPFACENCGSRFNSSAGLRWHIRLAHSVPSAVTEGSEYHNTQNMFLSGLEVEDCKGLIL